MTIALAYLAPTIACPDPTNWLDGTQDINLELTKRRRTVRAKASPLRIYQESPEIATEHASAEQMQTSPEISTKHTDAEQIFDAIQSLYLSANRPRDRQIAERITALHRDAIEEDEHILADSLRQFTAFFLRHPKLGLPKITLTPNATIRVRWIHGPGDFVAIEFTGKPLVKLVAELPRDNAPAAQYFVVDSIYNIISLAKSIGASLA